MTVYEREDECQSDDSPTDERIPEEMMDVFERAYVWLTAEIPACLSPEW